MTPIRRFLFVFPFLAPLAAPMTAQAQMLYRMLARQGHSELDTAAVIKLYETVGDPAPVQSRPAAGSSATPNQ